MFVTILLVIACIIGIVFCYIMYIAWYLIRAMNAVERIASFVWTPEDVLARKVLESKDEDIQYILSSVVFIGGDKEDKSIAFVDFMVHVESLDEKVEVFSEEWYEENKFLLTEMHEEELEEYFEALKIKDSIKDSLLKLEHLAIKTKASEESILKLKQQILVLENESSVEIGFVRKKPRGSKPRKKILFSLSKRLIPGMNL